MEIQIDAMKLLNGLSRAECDDFGKTGTKFGSDSLRGSFLPMMSNYFEHSDQ